MPAQRHRSLSSATKRKTHGHANPTTTATPLAPRSAQQSSALPQRLQDVVPSCAQECLETYISQDYSSCPQAGFPCLCSKYSSQGYTLGELAFVCLQAQCQSASQAKQVSLYDICADATNAVSPTHSTLTLPPATATVTAVPTTIPAAHTTGSYLSKSIAGASSVVPTASTSTTPASSSTTAAAKSSAHSTSLTSAQSVGISVAAFGGMAVLFALIYLVTCIRRRKARRVDKKSKHDSYDFIDKDPPRFSPFRHGQADPRGPLGGFAHPRIEMPSEKARASIWHQEPLPGQKTLSSLGVHGPEMEGARSLILRGRNESVQTLSQLLPEKPATAQQRIPPKRPDRSPTRPASMRTPATVFEEDRSPRIVSTQLPPLPMQPLPVHVGLPGRDIRNPQYTPQYTLSPDEMRAPALSLEIPRQATRTARIPSPTLFPSPPVPVDSPRSSNHRGSRSSKAKSGASTTAGSLLNYYASREAGSVPDFWEPEPTPISTDPQRSFKPALAAIKVPKPTYPPRAVRHSGSSDTSFESADPDEPTPPEEEDRRLSAVAEHSPIAAVRYPKVPRSSNQSIPRSPPAKLSPGLLYKRISIIAEGDRTKIPGHKRQQRSQHATLSPVTPERQNPDASTLSGSTLAAKPSTDTSASQLPHRRQAISPSPSPSRTRNISRTSPPRHNDTDTPAAAARLPLSLRLGGRHAAPLKGYGRVTSSAGRPKPSAAAVIVAPETTSGALTPELQMTVLSRSPTAQRFWPKLTPSRRGEDMFLQVGLLSPDAIGGVEGERRRAF
ncbi:hypothetical protein LTR08_002902 [Meristemomyces frigidus]|nr:hypothetical protein LTR08_002902 [Meristemomyces frigidus]